MIWRSHTNTKPIALLLAATTALSALPVVAQDDWRADMPVFRVGLLGGENEADRLRNNECLATALTERLGVPVEMFPAPDYAGVMQGLLAGQLDYASTGRVGICRYLPARPRRGRADLRLCRGRRVDRLHRRSCIPAPTAALKARSRTCEGKSLAYADPNSTSGYLIPRFELRRMGIVDEEYFSRTGFGGGHEQAAVAVLQGQYDAGVTWASGIGEASEGYTRGNLRRMIDNGLLDMADLNIIWESPMIPNGPVVVRKSMPQEAKDIVVDYLANQLETDPECYYDVSFGEGQGWVSVDHSFFEGVVEMRREELAASR